MKINASCYKNRNINDCQYCEAFDGGECTILSAEVINLTPHEVNIYDYTGTKILYNIPSSGIARVAQKREQIFSIGDIPISQTTFGEVEGLPQENYGVFYIVSSLVANILPKRKDLLIPDEAVRDSQGRIIGCKGLARI